MYRGLNVNPVLASSIELDALFDQDVLWSQAGDAVELSEKRPNATRALVKELHRVVQVYKKGYAGLVHQLAREVKGACRKSEVDWHKL